MPSSAQQKVIQYHQQTKHRPGQYARSAGYMDWVNQPLPYRLYEGTEKLHLPLDNDTIDSPVSALYQPSNAVVKPISIANISSMLQHSLGLSAWKSYNGTEWALRVNPSSGNLHPTECYLLLPHLGESSDNKVGQSVHYNPYIHSLEKRAVIPEPDVGFLNQSQGFAIALTSIAWREVWKYGERAYRYCQHDLGHALAALNIAANLNGWKVQVIDSIPHGKMEEILGLKQPILASPETEYVDCVCWVSREQPNVEKVRKWLIDFPELSYPHIANQLSQSYQDWPVIDEVFKASHSQTLSFLPSNTVLSTPSARAGKVVSPLTTASVETNINQHISAEKIIHQRRSAQSFDRSASFMSLALFLSQLQKTLPESLIPFSVLPQQAQVNLVLFVHDVRGLDSGLYVWVRNSTHLTELKASMSNQFQWHQPLPEQPLFCLKKGDYRRTAKALSCDQDIAADSAYSLGMLVRFDNSLHVKKMLSVQQNEEIKDKHQGKTINSASQYPLLFWETGIIGQVLYLAAETDGLRGTGIGCFFDDQVHELLGLKDLQWQSLYHFTVGKQIDDKRIASKPAYFHLQKK